MATCPECGEENALDDWDISFMDGEMECPACHESVPEDELGDD